MGENNQTDRPKSNEQHPSRTEAHPVKNLSQGIERHRKRADSGTPRNTISKSDGVCAIRFPFLDQIHDISDIPQALFQPQP